MTKNKFLKIRVSEDDLFKITENAGRENKKISEYVLSKVLETAIDSPVKGTDTDTVEMWNRLGEGIDEYLGYGGKTLLLFLTDIQFASAKKYDPVSWGAYVVEKLVAQGNKPDSGTVDKSGVWYSPSTDQI